MSSPIGLMLPLILCLIKVLVDGKPTSGTSSWSTCGYASCPTPHPTYLNVHLVPHTHDDVGWLKTVDQYFYGYKNNIQRAGVQYILDSVVDSLLKDPSRRFIYVESAFFWRWWKEQTQEMKDVVRSLIDEGRLEFIGGGWSMNDEAAAHYAAIIDNMAIGIKFLSQEFGNKCGRPRIGWQIDPFGHSYEHAHIMAEMGYDGLFLGRIDYADKMRRLVSRQMEMVWSFGGKSSSIFTGALYHTYSPPPGFCFDTLCTDVIMDDESLEDYNLDVKMADFVNYTRWQAEQYRSNNIILTMGEDFNYQNANMWYKNLDKIIKHVNARRDELRMNVFYSTPSCYLKAVHDSKAPLPAKEDDDFFPYASDPHAYWTGYFTSRPALKGMIRRANSDLQAAKQVHSEMHNANDDVDDLLDLSKRAVAVNQHHDAVTGTAKQHVTDDYGLRLHQSLSATHQVVVQGLGQRYGPETPFSMPTPDPSQTWCPLLNISQCGVTESQDKFSVVVYNPRPRTASFLVKLPVKDNASYQVVDDRGQSMKWQAVPIHPAVLEIPGRQSKAKFDLYIEAVEVPGLSSRVYHVERRSDITQAHNSRVPKYSSKNADRIENEYLKLESSPSSPFMTIQSPDSADKVNLRQEFAYYRPAVGDNSNFERRASGAYIFRPNGTLSVPLEGPVSRTVHKGELVQEIHMTFSDWVSQIVRVETGNPVVNFEWLVGPIPIQDGGKEVVSKFSTDLKSGEAFYTDSNGRGLLKRMRKVQSVSNNVELTEPISSNYYPVVSRLGTIDENAGKGVFVLTDRAQGGSSLKSGELELMVHRRLLFDDAFGVGEPLNETAFGEGLVVRGLHKLVVCANSNSDGCDVKSRLEAEKSFSEPVIMFGPPGSPNEKRLEIENSYGVSLPENIKLLTKEAWSEDGQILLRLENINVDGSSDFIKLETIFPRRKIASITETTLDGSAKLGSLPTLTWRADSNEIPPLAGDFGKRFSATDSAETAAGISGIEVEIGPGTIRTFLVQLEQ